METRKEKTAAKDPESKTTSLGRDYCEMLRLSNFSPAWVEIVSKEIDQLTEENKRLHDENWKLFWENHNRVLESKGIPIGYNPGKPVNERSKNSLRIVS